MHPSIQRQDHAITEEGLARIAAAGLNPEQLPRHIAIIMDGNGRWAQRRGLPRIVGHRRGIQSVRSVVEEGCRLGLEQLTLYCLSVENWKRPPRELKFLMRLLRHFLVVERAELIDQNVQLRMIGRRDGLPQDVLAEFDRTAEQTAENTGMILCLAVNYGGRTEIGDAARRLAEDVREGRVDPAQVDEDALCALSLHTQGMSDPDLLIRTAGEMRISNFLLWQISYTELWVTPTLWPDFRDDDLLQACPAYAGRERQVRRPARGLSGGGTGSGVKSFRRRAVPQLMSRGVQRDCWFPFDPSWTLRLPGHHALHSHPHRSAARSRSCLGCSAWTSGLRLGFRSGFCSRLAMSSRGRRAGRPARGDRLPPVGELGARRRAGHRGRQLDAARGRLAALQAPRPALLATIRQSRSPCWPGPSCASRAC